MCAPTMLWEWLATSAVTTKQKTEAGLERPAKSVKNRQVRRAPFLALIL